MEPAAGALSTNDARLVRGGGGGAGNGVELTERRQACVIASTTESRFAVNSAAAVRRAALRVSMLSEVIEAMASRKSVLADSRAAVRSASSARRSSSTQVRYDTKFLSIVEATADETAEAMDSPMWRSSGTSGAVAVRIASATAARVRSARAGASRSVKAEAIVDFETTWRADVDRRLRLGDKFGERSSMRPNGGAYP